MRFDHNRGMRRALYLLLTVWFALQSGLVQAHLVQESLHSLAHTAQADVESASNADHDDECAAVVCSCPMGAIFSGIKVVRAPLTSARPVTEHLLETSMLRNDIERPQWPHASSGVAGS